MEETKELVFSGISSGIVILGLAFLNIFGISLNHVPLLVSAALIGILTYKEIGKPNIAYILIASIAGLSGVMLIQGSPNPSQLISVATGFVIALALPSVLIELRKKLITRTKATAEK